MSVSVSSETTLGDWQRERHREKERDREGRKSLKITSVHCSFIRSCETCDVYHIDTITNNLVLNA